jgi:hypothetical protein
MSYLTELTVTYSALLDRMVALENLAYPTPAEHICSHPNHDNPGAFKSSRVFPPLPFLSAGTLV